ncbi:TetR family transcriptional regulator [Nocardia sp. SYP-A9097]|uniref:TetR/AcrR family transcriptional regulator n=1 Tax=Nocardia sp. SYP-A9097 TaxID=2663237 RepID=UPI00129B7A89|nr:TetR/AcrR family transcriptional regulator [Nocardia sp. SYP-A9097]MRH89145.1 TetR family transcriptional regulator [Nocardia sp. SYP-A9097]
MSDKPIRSRNRRGEGARLRDELVSAASTLLEDLDGQEALSLRAVARAAGIAPQSVYLHFNDRRELLTAVYQVRFGELHAALATARDAVPKDAAAERLSAICHAYIDYGTRNPGHYRVLFGTAGTPGWEPTEGQLPGLPTIQLLIEAAADCGSTDPNATAVCLWAAMHGLITLRQDRPSFPWPPLETLVRTMVDAHLAAAD